MIFMYPFLSDQLKRKLNSNTVLMWTERVLSNDPMLHLQTDLEYCDINTSRLRTYVTGDMNESRPFIIYMNIHVSCFKIVNGKKTIQYLHLNNLIFGIYDNFGLYYCN